MPKGMPLHHKATLSNAAKVMKGALGHCSPSTMLLIEDGEKRLAVQDRHPDARREPRREIADEYKHAMHVRPPAAL